MDRAGRLVIPRRIRRIAQLARGAPLEVRWRDGRIEIEPAALAVRLLRRGRILVAVPRKQVPKLAAETVEETRARLLKDRGTTK